MKTIPMLLAGLAIAWPAYAQSLGEALEQAWTRHPQASSLSRRAMTKRGRAPRWRPASPPGPPRCRSPA